MNNKLLVALCIMTTAYLHANDTNPMDTILTSDGTFPDRYENINEWRDPIESPSHDDRLFSGIDDGLVHRAADAISSWWSSD